MPNKKEPLSIMTVKTLLAVIIFTGVGTIIVGGGWLIGKHCENKANDKIIKPVDQEMRKCIKEGEKFYLKPGEPQTKECCPNLKTEAFYSIIDDKCIPETVASVCIDCPNDICGPGENKCNCPEDCKEEIDTADWQTYRNEELRFEVKYPEDWKINSYRGSQWIDIATVEKDKYLSGVGTPPKGNAWVSFITSIPENYKEFEKKEDNYGNPDSDEFVMILSRKIITNDTHAIGVTTGYWKGDSLAKQYNQIFDQILSTFKFIEKENELNWLSSNPLYFSSLVSPDGQKVVWTENKSQENKTNSKLMLADLDGQNKKVLIEKDFDGEKYFNLIRWSNSNEEIYFSEQYGGLGGYIVFGGPSNLSKINIYTSKLECLFEESNRIGYIGDISSNEEFIAYFPRIDGNPKLAIKNMKTGKENIVDIPIEEGFKEGGNAHFSPDNKYLVYNIAYCNPDDEYYRTIIINSEGKNQRTIIDDSQKIYRAMGWISNDEILLRGPNSIDYIIDINGSSLRKK